MTTIVTVRPGVQFAPDAAASFARAEAAWGRPITVTFSYRPWALQLQMYNTWNCYLAGRCPRPSYYRPIHPSLSWHVKGTALDTPDWQLAGFVQHMREHGWLRVVSDEAWHFQYYPRQDRHIGEPAALPIPEEAIMANATIIVSRKNPQLAKGIFDPEKGKIIRELNGAPESAVWRGVESAQTDNDLQVVFVTVTDSQYNALNV